MALHVLGAGAVLFALGAASMPLMKAAAPFIGRALRPIVRMAVKEGVLIQRQVQAVVQEAWQDVEHLTAEAQAEPDRQARGDETAS
jgi:ABC-type protease/lipase transport system fused ATPase/permease subunit